MNTEETRNVIKEYLSQIQVVNASPDTPCIYMQRYIVGFTYGVLTVRT